MHEVKARFPRGRVVRERYQVEELLGQGGFGAVYRVRDRRVKGNVFALKEVIDPNKHQRENFLFEGEVLRRLDHPSLPRVYRVFEDQKKHRLYMLMDYVAGPNLERWRKKQPDRRFSFEQALQMMTPILKAVGYLHEQQPPIIHRDIKPANIIVLNSGEGASLVDFGIAKEYDQESTTTAIRLCSPGYGAPEQYIQGTNNQTDIYGLGATFYTLLTGEVPIDALYRVTRISSKGDDPLRVPLELVPDIPEGVSDALLRALAVSSQDRFATVQEFWDELRQYISDGPQPVSVMSGASETKSAEEVSARVDAAPVTTGAIDASSPVVKNTQERPVSTPVWMAVKDAPPKRRRLVVGLTALVLLVLLSGAATGVWNIWLRAQEGATAQANTNATATVQAGQETVTPQESSVPPTTAPTATPLPTITPIATSEPTAPPTGYPAMATYYSGTMHNSQQNIDDSLAFTQVQQSSGQVSGYLDVGPQHLGDGPFEGTVTTDRQFSFQRELGGSYAPLFFSGTIADDGSISGTYCSLVNGQCDNSAGGYGTWQVQPF